jgi:hypothetical protein
MYRVCDLWLFAWPRKKFFKNFRKIEAFNFFLEKILDEDPFKKTPQRRVCGPHILAKFQGGNLSSSPKKVWGRGRGFSVSVDIYMIRDSPKKLKCVPVIIPNMCAKLAASYIYFEGVINLLNFPHLKGG